MIRTFSGQLTCTEHDIMGKIILIKVNAMTTTTTEDDKRTAEEYAERVVLPDIDSLRYSMKDPYKLAKADFLAGIEHERKRISDRIHTEVFNTRATGRELIDRVEAILNGTKLGGGE